MTEKIKNILVITTFVGVITIMLLVNIIKEDTQISVSERRKLEQFPKISFEKIVDGSFFSKFDKYVTDQFVARETFRKTKVLSEKEVFRKLDYNNIYEKDGMLIEQLYPLNEKSILNLANKINSIKESYLTKENKVYFTIVPDKNYFVSGDNLKLDYQKMKDIMKEQLDFAEYIDIFDELKLSDYYITDSHWKQENIQNVAKKILKAMGIESNQEYEAKEILEFKGVYAGQYPITTKNDKIIILTNENTASASEILAGALKDLGKAKTVGTTTYGKGVIQQILKLSDGSGLKVTIEEYQTPNRNKINKVGIEPDEKVELPDTVESILNVKENEDTQLQKAIEMLK